MPVLSSEDNKALGIVTISNLVRLYDSEVEKIMKVRKGNRGYGSNSMDTDDRNDASRP
jgi:hypothetical protein